MYVNVRSVEYIYRARATRTDTFIVHSVDNNIVLGVIVPG